MLQLGKTSRIIRGRVPGIAVVATMLVLPLSGLAGPTGAVAAPAGVAATPVQEVTAVDATDLGLVHPSGVAYSERAGGLVVASRQGGAVQAVVATTVGDPLAEYSLPDAEPTTLTVDPRGDAFDVLTGRDLVRVTPDRAARREQLGNGVPGTPAGAAFDPAGVLYTLDATTHSIARVEGTAAARGSRGRPAVTGIPLGGIRGDAPLRGLAVNPTDGLLYVGSPSEQLLYGVDGAGVVRNVFDLSPLALTDPQGFTFGPSADTTDDPGMMHLYVTDSGGGASGGLVMEAALTTPLAVAATLTATLVQRIATSAWSPASPDPSGIEYVPAQDRFEVVDSEVDETTGAGYHNVNMWQVTRQGVVTDTGTTWTPSLAYSKEPTGLGFMDAADPAARTLFISDDSAHRIWIVRAGPDTRFGTNDDVVSSLNPTLYGSNDTEDPEYDPTTGHLFFIDGVNVEVYDIDPVDGVFGNGNDTMTHFDVQQFGPTDIEGLGSDPVHGTLLVGGRVTKKIYEVTKAGALVQVIDASGITGLRYISGLQQAPASDGSGRRAYWTVDRNIDNGSNSSENDGQLFELSVPGTENTAPVVNAGTDQTIAAPTTSVNVSGLVNDDGLPNPPGATTVTWSQVSGPASVSFGDATAVSTTVGGFTTVGDYTLRLTASDSALSSSDDVVVHVVANSAPVVNAGTDQTVSGTTSVSVGVTVTDDGFPNPPGATTVTWSQVSGPASVSFGDANAVSTTVSGLTTVGDYTLRLTASDSALSSSDDVVVHVVANTAPVVNAGTDQTISVSTSVDLAGTVSDDGLPNPPGATTATWSQVSGPASVSFGDANAVSTLATGFTAVGDYVLRLTASDSSLSASDDVTVHVPSSSQQTVDIPLAASTDDAEQSTSGSVNVTSSDLDMMADGTTVQAAVGLRFANIPVPKGATVDSAYIQFTADEAHPDATTLTIQGQAVDNAPTFSTTKNSIASRSRTAASAAWTVVPWTTVGARGLEQRTSDLAPILQELALRPGWASGNAAAFVVTGSGKQVARASDSSRGGTAVLHVVYTTGLAPPNQAPVVDAGPDQSVTLPASASLTGTVVDDGLPSPPGATTVTWSQVSGPGAVSFGDANAQATYASFPAQGTYVLRLTASDGSLSASDDVTVQVLGPGSVVTVDIPLVASSDDAEQKGTGGITLTSTDLDLMTDRTSVQAAVGLRFANIPVPKGATVNSAYIQFTVDEATSDATTLTIQGQAVDNAPTFSTTKNSITARSRTAASAAWIPPGWATVGAHGPAQQTSDLGPILQELVQRSGWATGNAAAFIVTGSGKRVARAFDSSLGGTAVLHVVYTL